MIDRNYFKQIKTGLAHPPDVEDYYNKICSYISANPEQEFKELSELVDQKTLIEEVYGFSKDKPVEPNSKINDRTPKSVLAKVDEILDRDLPEDELMAVLNYFAQDFSWQPQRLLQLYKVRQQLKEEEHLKEEFQGELNSILKLARVDIHVDQYLPPALATPLIAYCQNSQVRHAIALLHLLTGVSVCHKVGTRVTVDVSKNWYEPTNLFSMMVSPSGQGKSPVLKTLITSPFWEIQQRWKASHEEAETDYAIAQAEMKSLPKEERSAAMKELSKPADRPKILFATDPTIIGFNCQFNAYPDQGILGTFDEARKLLGFDRTSSQNSDHADFLSYFNGGATVELRADGVRTNVGETLLSLIGGIQPEILMDWMNIHDPDGQWARFILVSQPLQRKFPSRDNGSVDIKDAMIGIYQKLLNQSRRTYCWGEQAGKLFDDYVYGEVEDNRMHSLDPGLRSLYGKCGSKVARLAVNLHCLSDPQNLEIGFETVENAIMLNRFYLNQTKIFYCQSQALAGEVAPKFAQIVEISRQVGAITARELSRKRRAFRKDDLTQIRQWFKQLESLGKGKCEGNGTRMKFRAF